MLLYSTPQYPYGPYYLNYLTAVGGNLFFTQTNIDTGVGSLWESDGTAAGTVLVEDFSGYYFNPNKYFANAAFLMSVNGTLFFDGPSPSGYESLWESDGTARGLRSRTG